MFVQIGRGFQKRDPQRIIAAGFFADTIVPPAALPQITEY